METSNVNTLTSRFFQAALSGAATAASNGLLADRLGLVVTDIEDIDQCIRVIAHTPLGSDPHRPDFGTDLDRYVDYPVTSARPYIARELQRALSRWEPRIDLVRVSVALADVAQLLVSISWKISANYSGKIFVTNLALGQLA